MKSALQNVEMMFDDHHRMSLLEQGVERIQEFGHIVHVKSVVGSSNTNSVWP